MRWLTNLVRTYGVNESLQRAIYLIYCYGIWVNFHGFVGYLRKKKKSVVSNAVDLCWVLSCLPDLSSKRTRIFGFLGLSQWDCSSSWGWVGCEAVEIVALGLVIWSAWHNVETARFGNPAFIDKRKSCIYVYKSCSIYVVSRRDSAESIFLSSFFNYSWKIVHDLRCQFFVTCFDGYSRDVKSSSLSTHASSVDCYVRNSGLTSVALV